MTARRPGAVPRVRGATAERLVETWLVQRGCLPLARNFPTRYGELDLVVAERDTVVFVEVKRRRTGAAIGALESVTPQKARRIVLAAQEYVRRAALDERALRFDVVAVTSAGRGRPPELVRIEAAFDASVLEE